MWFLFWIGLVLSGPCSGSGPVQSGSVWMCAASSRDQNPSWCDGMVSHVVVVQVWRAEKLSSRGRMRKMRG